jgi:histidine triad (HIT) family protein
MGKSSLIKDWIARFARSRFGRPVTAWVFTNWNSLLPLDRVYESPVLVAFRHPQPAHQFHVLIVPKRRIRDLSGLSNHDGELLLEVSRATTDIVRRFGLETSGYKLIVNGGAYQDIPQLHFHLVSESIIHAGTKFDRHP